MAGVRVPPPQFDLFPERAVIERLDPRAQVGPRTGVLDLVRVRLRPADVAHLVFHDRHGWYCETHGPACPSVPAAIAELAALAESAASSETPATPVQSALDIT